MELLLIFPLLLMIVQDFRCRNVFLWQLLLFGVMQGGGSIYKYGLTLTTWNVLINVAILAIISLTVAVYAFLRFRGKQKIIGLGDVFFILFLTPSFYYLHFLYFLIVSFSLTLIGWLIYIALVRDKTDKIPLISGVGICYSALLVYNVIIAAI